VVCKIHIEEKRKKDPNPRVNQFELVDGKIQINGNGLRAI